MVLASIFTSLLIQQQNIQNIIFKLRSCCTTFLFAVKHSQNYNFKLLSLVKWKPQVLFEIIILFYQNLQIIKFVHVLQYASSFSGHRFLCWLREVPLDWIPQSADAQKKK